MIIYEIGTGAIIRTNRKDTSNLDLNGDVSAVPRRDTGLYQLFQEALLIQLSFLEEKRRG